MRARVHSRVDDPSWYRVDSFVCYSLSNAGGIDKCQGRLRACRLGMGGLHSSVFSTSTGYGICASIVYNLILKAEDKEAKPEGYDKAQTKEIPE